DILREERELSDRVGAKYWVDGLPTSDLEEIRINTKKILDLMLCNKFPNAIKIIENTLLLTTSPSERSALLLMMGNCKYFLGKYDEAQKYYGDSIKILQRTSKEESFFGKSAALGNIGLIYRAKGDLDNALKYLKRALKILDRFNLEYGRGIILDAIDSIGTR
ncbi:MAG: tetratricopeptide repeat protein, partial [bacterium]